MAKSKRMKKKLAKKLNEKSNELITNANEPISPTTNEALLMHKDSNASEKKVENVYIESSNKITDDDTIDDIEDFEDITDDIIDIESDDEENIHNESFGIGKNGRIALTYTITAMLCAAILFSSYLLAIHIPGDDERVDTSVDALREDASYKELVAEHESLSYDTDKLRNSAEAKKAKVESINDYDNTKAQLRTEIEDKKSQISSLQESNSKKEDELEALNAEIKQKSGSMITVPAGRYVVGKTTLPAGKYQVTGSGIIQVAANGTSKLNNTLGDTPIEVTLEQNDIVKIDSTTKFTPIG